MYRGFVRPTPLQLAYVSGTTITTQWLQTRMSTVLAKVISCFRAHENGSGTAVAALYDAALFLAL
jgi:hypothetical protein